MKNLAYGPLLLLLCLTLSACDLEELKRLQREPPPGDDPIVCPTILVNWVRSIFFFKLGDTTHRKIHLYSNDALIWTSEQSENSQSSAIFANGVLKYMSSEDFEELRVEEFAMDGEPLRSPLVFRLLNGRSDEDSAGCGYPGSRPPQLYFDFGKLTN